MPDLKTAKLVAFGVASGVAAWSPRSQAEDFDVISRTSPQPNTTVIRIDRPDIRTPSKAYPQITFQPGDVIQIDAGGCAQHGGRGRTWRLYAAPTGDDADHLYHGLISIPGITNGLTWFQNLTQKSWTVQPGTPPNSELTLGFTDDGYSDNGYGAHDDGENDQCKNVGPAWVTLIVTKGAASPNEAAVEQRISGLPYFKLNAKDSNDYVTATNGYLCVVHNPGCGMTGNDGEDVLFDAGLSLPSGVRIDKLEFQGYAPGGLALNDSGTIGGWGSYGIVGTSTVLNPPAPVRFRWHNACQGVYGGKSVYYTVSVIVSATKGIDLSEKSYDPAAMPPASCAPPDFSKPPAAGPSGLEGTVKVCNPGAETETASLHIEGACSPPTAGPADMCKMSEDIPVSFPAGGGFASAASFRTKQIYHPGTWTITKAQVTRLTAPLQSPITVQLPGSIGSPVLDFTGGSCTSR